MRLLFYFLLSLVALSSGSCQEARRVKIKVNDEAGAPIEGANVTVWYSGHTPEKTKSVKGESDSNGIFQANGTADLRVEIWIKKDGYYESKALRLSRKKDHDLTFVLRKIKKPIPLYAKRTRLIAPVTNEQLGYDFEVRDWVAPHGKGKATDILFRVVYKERDRKDYDYELEVTFPNKLDGIQEFSDDRLSELKSKHEAPSAGYRPSWIQKTQRRPDTGRSGNRDRSRNFWMRVRSKVDESGKLVSAHYVKMYGDFPDLHCYFNPTPNDRNLEFDPKKNLFKKLESTERVHEP